jgi:CelD/BcsL family acetyltransferase involved in cellulose biosynthesis
MPTIEIMKGGMIFDRLTDEWHHLIQTSPFATPFQSREWLKNWTEHFANQRQLRTIVIREGSDLVGLFPMIQSHSVWSSLRPLGVGPSDYLGPLLLDDGLAAQEGMRDVLMDFSKSHLVDLHQIPSDHPFSSQFIDFDPIEQARCLILDLPATYEAYVASLSKSLRYDVRRLEGKALKERGAIVEWVNPENVDEFADQFFALHKARWKSRGLPGAFFGKGEQFQRAWMVAAVESGTLIMNRLVSGGNSVGIVYAMKQGTTCYFYQAGMDPNASSLSPGTILVSKMIERAIDLGCTTFDFMRGDEPYKRRWKPNRERINSRILLSQDSVVGKTGMWWNNTAWRVELKVRERLEGKSLMRLKPQNQPHDVKHK